MTDNTSPVTVHKEENNLLESYPISSTITTAADVDRENTSILPPFQAKQVVVVQGGQKTVLSLASFTTTTDNSNTIDDDEEPLVSFYDAIQEFTPQQQLQEETLSWDEQAPDEEFQRILLADEKRKYVVNYNEEIINPYQTLYDGVSTSRETKKDMKHHVLMDNEPSIKATGEFVKSLRANYHFKHNGVIHNQYTSMDDIKPCFQAGCCWLNKDDDVFKARQY